MKTLFFAGVAALAVVAMPSVAQVGGAGPEATTSSVADKRGMEMNDEQRAMYDAMPADQRAAFDMLDPERQVMYFGWEEPVRAYYMRLPSAQQEAWWYLTDDQRMSIYNLAPAQRETAWSSVINQVNQTQNPGSDGNAAAMPGSATRSNTMARSGMASGNINYVSNPVMQNIPAPHQGEYPPCRGDREDNCINPREMSR